MPITGSISLAASQSSPFKFLDAYQREDKDIFFGREAETEEMYQRVFETNLLLLYGASGTGKTSLLNCGLANKFEPQDWLPVMVRWGDNFERSLRVELQSRLPANEVDALTPIPIMLKYLYLEYFKPVYLIFDQFEELFILGSREEAVAFFKLLVSVLESEISVKVIVSMREEYLAHLSEYEHMIPTLFDNRMRVERMGLRNLEDVIFRTTAVLGIDLTEQSETVVDGIISRLRSGSRHIALTDLQVYLDRLYRLDWVRRGNEKRPIRFDTPLLEQTGQLADVLAVFLDEQVQRLEIELRERWITMPDLPLAVLFTMVSDNATKQPRMLEEIRGVLLDDKGVDPAITDFCVRRLERLRLLRDLGDSKYEVAHDILAKKVYDKTSAEEKMRLRVERFIAERYDYYLARRVLLASDDIQYIKPYRAVIRLLPEQELFVKKSEQALRLRRRSILITILGTVLLLMILSVWALGSRAKFQYSNALLEQKKQELEVKKRQEEMQAEQLQRTNASLRLNQERLQEREQQLAGQLLVNAELLEAQRLSESRYRRQLENNLQAFEQAMTQMRKVNANLLEQAQFTEQAYYSERANYERCMAYLQQHDPLIEPLKPTNSNLGGAGVTLPEIRPAANITSTAIFQQQMQQLNLRLDSLQTQRKLIQQQVSDFSAPKILPVKKGYKN